MTAWYFLGWLALVGVVGSVVSVYDKWAAKHNPRHRVREKTLLRLGAIGGALLMYLTMQLIRHKTQHKYIMRGLIVSFLAHALILGFLLYREGVVDWLTGLF